MITTFKQISSRLLDAILTDPTLLIVVLEMGWDHVDTPLGPISVQTRIKKAVERMDKDRREVFFKLHAGQINGRIIAHPPRPRALKRLREKEVAARQHLDVLGFTETEWAAADLEVDGAFRLGWLLCGGLDFGATPLGRAIHGGGWVDPDLGCGPVSYVSADEVREAAAAFSQISEGDLEGRVDSGTVDWELVSPGDLPGLLASFPLVRNYYADAAYRGYAMIVFDGW